MSVRGTRVADTQWTTERLMVALADRYKAPEFALLPQVRNATGYARVTRTADAIAMSLWPSRGLELHGFEIKAFRNDWVREKRDPAKAEEIASRMDRWWVVVGDEAMVRPGELPPTWGLLAPHGNTLAVKVEAPRLKAQPIDRAFLAALLRKASEVVISKTEIEAAVQAERERLEAVYDDRVKSAVDRETGQQRRHWDEMKVALDKFEAVSGIKIDRYNHGNIAAAVAFLTSDDYSGIRETPLVKMQRFVEEARVVADEAMRALAVMKKSVDNG